MVPALSRGHTVRTQPKLNWVQDGGGGGSCGSSYRGGPRRLRGLKVKGTWAGVLLGLSVKKATWQDS